MALPHDPRPIYPRTPELPVRFESPYGVVVVAGSSGGMSALLELLSVVPEGLPLPVLVAQHLSLGSKLVDVLRARSRLSVEWAGDLFRLRPGTIYVAPPERHLIVRSKALGALRSGPKVNFARPSADPLFRSAARHYGRGAIGIILSGLLSDGAAGAEAIRAAGGVVLVQNPESCRASSMPAAALQRTQSKLVLPPRAIGHAITSLTMLPGVATLFGVAV